VIRLLLQAFSPLATVGVDAVRTERHMESAPLIVMNLTARPGEHPVFVVVAVKDREDARHARASLLSGSAHVLAQSKRFQCGNNFPSIA
jgi:hypothetical protein